MVKAAIEFIYIKQIYRFGPFTLDTGQRLLTRDGGVVPLTHKAFETLALLVQHNGRVLQKEEMMKSIWPDSFVEEATLAQNVFILRKVLGETPLGTRYIETVPKYGYRFVAEVEEVAPSPGGQVTEARNGSRTAKSVAVLPFKVLTSDTGSEYFGIGMADALITRLSNIEEVTVRPSSAILKYDRPDVDLCAAGSELKVQLLLDGIIQRFGDRIRVTVQLVNTEDGAPLWAGKFDEKVTDIFAIQDIISGLVVEALTLKLTSAQRVRLTKHHTKNSEAYRYYLKGRYLWSKWTKEGFNKGIALFEHAIKLEPDYALPYAGIADTYISMCFYGHMRSYEAMTKVKTKARKALQLDDQLAEARLPLAAALFFYDWDWAGAEEEFKRAIQANPNYAAAHQSYGLYLIAMSRFDEALASMHRAQEIDPVSPLIKTTIGFPYYYSGQYEQAIRQYHEALEEDPSFGLTRVALADVYTRLGSYEQAIESYEQGLAMWEEKSVLPYLGHVYGLSNRRQQALDVLNKLKRLSGQEYISPFSMAVVCAGLGEADEMFDWLEKAYEERSNKLVFLDVQPVFYPFRGDARFIDLLRRIGYEP
ncbi:MAG TPA: winged helix-turn-helix domain-containing protein [Blastocatellia bacterium]|nr:winged helix-turn-helix domain-containing protein [Blastocatellia bacterium]